MAVPLHRRAGELAAADDDDLAAVLLQLLDQRDEVAVAADDDEGVDVVVGEGHLERVERHGDVGAVLVAAGRHVALHHPDGVLREQAAVVAGALPVAVGDLGDDLAAFLDGFEDEADVELAADGGFDADFDVVEVDGEKGDRWVCCVYLVAMLASRLSRVWGGGLGRLGETEGEARRRSNKGGGSRRARGGGWGKWVAGGGERDPPPAGR